MRIVSLIERVPSDHQKYVGTKVHLDGKEYHFKPTDDDKRHTCEVEDKAHQKLLLAIKEGYRDADAPDEEPQKVASIDGDDGDGFNATSETQIEIDGEIVDLEKQTRDKLVTIMRKLKIDEPKGYKGKPQLIAHILKTLDEQMPG